MAKCKKIFRNIAYSFDQVSKTNGRPKTNIVRSHIKKTTNGYTTVNSYRRSSKIR